MVLLWWLFVAGEGGIRTKTKGPGTGERVEVRRTALSLQGWRTGPFVVQGGAVMGRR